VDSPLKLLLVSDLHVDLLKDGGMELINTWKYAQVDVICIAGDIGELRDPTAQFFILRLAEFHRLILLGGNHCFWGSSPQQVDQIWEKMKLPNNVTLLKTGETFTLNGQRFIGGDLWYDRPKGPNAFRLTKEFPDFRRIKDFTPWVYDEHKRLVKFLEENLLPSDFVITHHSPSYQTVQKEFDGDPWNCFFMNSLDQLILDKQPKYWHFGHQHQHYEGVIGNTKLICNAKGYKGETTGFNPNFVVEI
jgi:Icc-related predicted phosphoesterase